MKPLSEFLSTPRPPVHVLCCDIDDTLTDDGLIGAAAYAALWRLHDNGVAVVPVTGRPAGWCEMIARTWPVAGVIGENGGFYFRLVARKMMRHFKVDESLRIVNRRKLDQIARDVTRDIPGCAIASDQFARLLDLAVDFAEDVGPLPAADIDRIVAAFHAKGATAKVSSIHVNGWFGDYDKLGMCQDFARHELGVDLSVKAERLTFAFAGDSPNDEPMFAYFENSFGVANVQDFASRLRSPPQFVAPSRGGTGFVEIADAILTARAAPSIK